jgi:predicted nucleic acid-binding protein
MKILLDSNVLFPTWLYPQGVCAKALGKALDASCFSAVVCTYSAEELLNVCNRRHPERMAEIQAFISEIFLKV